MRGLTGFIAALMIGLTASCSQPAYKATPEGQPGYLPIHEETLAPSPYRIEWGSLRIPLSKFANPEVYKGEAELALDEFRTLIGQPLSVLHEGQSLPFEVVQIHREPYQRFGAFWFSYPDYTPGEGFDASVVSTFQSGIRPGNVIDLRIDAADSIRIQYLRIRIIDPLLPYSPVVKVPHPRHTQEAFGFQVIQESGQRPMLRIDTAATHTRHIYELYQQNALYKIINIPGFRTYNRLIADRDQLFSTQEIRRTTALTDPIDWRALPDYMDYRGPEVELRWGQLVANPMSTNYHLWQIEGQLQQALQLFVGPRLLPIHSFQLIIAGEAQQPEMWVASSLQQTELAKRLWQLQPAQTLYVNRIIVEPEPGCLQLFPQAFAFNIEAARPFRLVLKETASAKPFFVSGQDTTGSPVRLSIQGVTLSNALLELLELDSSQVNLGGLHQDPELNITFASSRYSLSDGRAMILEQLEDQYRLEIDWRPTPPQYELHLSDSLLLKEHLTTEDPGRIIWDAQERTALVLRAPLSEVLQLMQRELGVPVHNNLSVGEVQLFRGHLDCSSIAAARSSLAQFGLSLRRSKACAQVVVRQRPLQ
ncbi:MAG: hypothetical protein RIC19_23325 [Phaeodactylibacter sp.]|uniref:hypothetical protein n=1 Tax=Phaeodactylibacter sp. TaxID=1940289 RepID=UPI0032EBB863